MNLLYLFGVVAVGFVIWSLALFIFSRIKIKESKSWPTTAGRITHSSVKSEFVQVGGGSALIYSPKVVYEYEVAGKRYTSSQLAIVETNTASEDLAREKADKYTLDQHVTVHYEPRNPAFAVLNLQ